MISMAEASIPPAAGPTTLRDNVRLVEANSRLSVGAAD